MEKHSFSLSNKLSVSLSSILESRKQHEQPIAAARSTGFLSNVQTPTLAEDLVAVIIKVSRDSSFEDSKPDLSKEESLELIGEEYYSGQLKVSTLQELAENQYVDRIETKKTYTSKLDQAATDIGLLTASATRSVTETGENVLIGIVDSGFDLSHPMLRDSEGKLRVVALLDQTLGNKEYNTTELELQWVPGGFKPGRDTDGHGTHVATIAGGSKFSQYEGIAPKAKFLLVKTDFINIDNAVSWIYRKADSSPCVVNLSLGGHFGSHDGTSNAERLYNALVGPGKILVVAAGNERNQDLHLNGLFVPNQIEEVAFDIFPAQSRNANPSAPVTFWYPDIDDYDIELITPFGQALSVPSLNNTDQYRTGDLEIQISRLAYAQNNLTQVQIIISFNTSNLPLNVLDDWRFRIRCLSATVGRFDAWFANSGFARFRPHPLVKFQGTIGIPATAEGCIAVASHVSKNNWESDAGMQQDVKAFAGRSSNFSSVGPTRDGRWKPEISAPGHYITAALADGSNLSNVLLRSKKSDRLLSLEGTSMSAPIVTGAIALMLQKNPNLTPNRIKAIFQETAKKDIHTQDTPWTPIYGYGKLDIIAALDKV